MSIFQIPDLSYLIFRQISIRDRINLLATCKSLHQLTTKERFWTQQIRIDFSRQEKKYRSKKHYQQLYHPFVIPVYYDRQHIDTVSTHLGDVEAVYNRLVSKYHPNQTILVGPSYNPITWISDLGRLHTMTSLRIVIIPPQVPINVGSIFYFLQDATHRLFVKDQRYYISPTLNELKEEPVFRLAKIAESILRRDGNEYNERLYDELRQKPRKKLVNLIITHLKSKRRLDQVSNIDKIRRHITPDVYSMHVYTHIDAPV